MDTELLWKTILSELEISLSRGNFVTWILPTKLMRVQQIDAGRQLVEIACKSAYHRQFIEERYLGQIKESLDRITRRKNELVLTIKDFSEDQPLQSEEDGPLFQRPEESSAGLYRRAFQRARLREDFTFEMFAVSSSNEMAYAAAQAVAKSLGKAYNPLFLYGGVGVGKTHLTQALGHAVLQDNPDLPLIYCTGEEFTNGIIEAIRRKETHPFKKKFRSAKLLLIDDIQFIAGKASVQEEFFHTFNAIRQEGGQIVLVSDQSPDAIAGLEDRLRSRFEGGLTIDIQKPNFELRTAILLIKANTLGMSLPMEIAQLIAANIESSRRLEGFLARLKTEAELRRQEISDFLVRGLLGNPQNSELRPLPSLRPKDVLKTVAVHFSVTLSSLVGPRRSKPLVVARHLAMYILRTDYHLPLEEIGSLFEGRDHTTVIHAVDKISKNLSNTDSLRVEVENIRKKIYE